MRRIPEQVSSVVVGRCFEWTGAVDAYGYGRDGASRPAHRSIWELYHGRRAPWHMVVMHLCDNPPCVNPAHLRLGTHAENQADKVAKGRQAKGEIHGRARLDPAKVTQVLDWFAEGKSKRWIARAFGIHDTTVAAIIRGDTWRDVPRKIALV